MKNCLRGDFNEAFYIDFITFTKKKAYPVQIQTQAGRETGIHGGAGHGVQADRELHMVKT